MSKIRLTVIRRLIFIVFALLYIEHCAAQNELKTEINSIADIQTHILNNFHPDSVKAANICENSCAFVRFKILKNRQVGDLACTKKIPDFIAKALFAAAKSLENKTDLADSILSDTRVYLQPLVYNYQLGCKTFYSQEKLTTIQKNQKDEPVDSRKEGDGILNMLNFTDKQLTSLDCIILSPIRTGNMGY